MEGHVCGLEGWITVTRLILLKGICRVLSKPYALFAKIVLRNPKIHPQRAKAVLNKKNKAAGLILPNFKYITMLQCWWGGIERHRPPPRHCHPQAPGDP